MQNTPTPHILAKKGEIADIVVMPGDPIRAQIMAERFLKDAKLVSSVRNNLCFSGSYNGIPVTIMSSGMGGASMGIYAYELFSFYGVKNIIRVGTAGSLSNSLKIGDIVLAENSITDTNAFDFFKNNGKESVFPCSKSLLKIANNIIKKKAIPVTKGIAYSTDTFYSSSSNKLSSGALCVEMESGVLYGLARKLKKNALCLLTISDEPLNGKTSSSKERETHYDKMFLLALEIAKELKG